MASNSGVGDSAQVDFQMEERNRVWNFCSQFIKLCMKTMLQINNI